MSIVAVPAVVVIIASASPHVFRIECGVRHSYVDRLGYDVHFYEVNDGCDDV